MKARRIHVLAAAFALALGCSNTIVAPTGGTGAGSGTAGSGTGADSSGTTNPCSGPACACGSNALVDRLTTNHGPPQVDLLLMIDNGGSAAEKQSLLALSLPDLIDGIVNPRCLDNTTQSPVPQQPTSPVESCPAGSTREFQPVLDMHVGVLSSSLGTFGTAGCPDPTPGMACGPGSTNNDHGHLVTRSDACGQAMPVATYQNLGFLAWDPLQKLSPPGETSLGGGMTPGLNTSLDSIVLGVGNDGCGFRSQNESWYRFLVDPTPYQSIALVNNTVQTTGVDMTLLQQRQDFLRPGSILAIVTLTDHSDSSLKEYSQYPLFAAPSVHLPLPRTECSTKGPDDPCCASCGQGVPSGCPVDPVCAEPPPGNSYTPATENTGLRTFGLVSHKARYGIEFFYPPSRYVQGLTSPTVTDNDGKMLPNPIYSGSLRDPSQVLYATITGVPWQLIARQSNGVPDLINGVSTVDPTKVGGFKTGAELSQMDTHGHSFWDDIAGDPEHYVPPLSPFMEESTVPRSGVDPVTGVAISPTTSPNGTNPINGHERTIPTPAGDIEYACVFPALAATDCSNPASGYCDCPSAGSGGPTDNPLCDPNPADSGNPTLQTRSKAYPGLRNLAIAHGMGTQGIVGSICAKQLTDNTAPDFGYRPAVAAILDRFRSLLVSESGPLCLAQALPVDGQGLSTCSVVEASQLPGGACNCNVQGRAPLSAADQCVAQAAMADPFDEVAKWNCFCEIVQTTGSCQNDALPTGDGWCYIDADSAPPVGNPALVAKCPSGEQRQVRFVGNGAPVAGATVFLACH
jgi:hypothetical protein